MDNELIFYLITIVILLILSGLFSAAETALTAVSRARIYQLMMNGDKKAKKVNKIKEQKETMISTILLSNNAVNIAASALATALAIRLFGDGSGLLIVTVVMTLLVVIFSEVLPKTYAIQNAEKVSLVFSTPLAVLMRLFIPLTISIQFIIIRLMNVLGMKNPKNSMVFAGNDVVRGTIELQHREGKLIKQDRDMLGSILDLNDVEIKDIMIHRKEVQTLDCELPVNEFIEEAISTQHTRIPIWKEQTDNIIGILHVKDLIKLIREHGDNLTIRSILEICSDPWFVPEITNLRDQLLEFRNRRQHFALVIDEYGDWQGIVTLEDIIEEIVGDIEDEHDEIDNNIQKIKDGSYIINGNVTIRDINRHLSWNLPDDNASTIAGLLIHEARTIPDVNETHNFHGFDCTVLKKSATQITRVKMTKHQDAENDYTV
ncbi:MAG: CNNM domain-containing protein [Rickettsiales bacterium]